MKDKWGISLKFIQCFCNKNYQKMRRTKACMVVGKVADDQGKNRVSVNRGINSGGQSRDRWGYYESSFRKKIENGKYSQEACIMNWQKWLIIEGRIE